jgi:hypothetical protein
MIVQLSDIGLGEVMLAACAGSEQDKQECTEKPIH